MATESVNYKCIACGGTMELDPKTGQLVCEYCDSRFSPEEVEAYYAEQQAKQDAEAQEASRRAEAGEQSAYEQMGDYGSAPSALTEETIEEAVEVSSSEADPIDAYLSRASWDDDERKGMRSFKCSSCGAQTMVDATTAVTECPYCGNTTVISGALTDEARPDYVIPFKVGKQAAADALNGYYKDKKFLPSEFASANRVEHIQGVYVPFWLYDGRAYGSGRFHATRVHTRKHGGETETITEHFEVERAGDMYFENVPADGSDKMPDAHMDSIEPYRFDEMEPFSVGYMPGYMAERYDRDAKSCSSRARTRMENTFEDKLEDSVTGYSTKTRGEVVSNSKITKVSQALLPVWMLHTSWQGEDYLFAMNGQTGKMVGDLPVSKGKVVAWFLGIFAVVLAILLGLDFGVFHMADATGGMSIIFDVGVPAGIAAGTCSAYYNQMKTAKAQETAQGYAVGRGLNLSRSEDRLVNRTVKRTHNNSGGGRGGAPRGGGGRPPRGGGGRPPRGGGGRRR